MEYCRVYSRELKILHNYFLIEFIISFGHLLTLSLSLSLSLSHTHTHTHLDIYYQNIRGLSTVASELLANVYSSNFNVICVTETWLNISCVFVFLALQPIVVVFS